MCNIVKIEFFNRKTCYCAVESYNLKLNLTVIVKNDKGLEFGTVVEFMKPEFEIVNSENNRIIRIATKQDYQKHLQNIKEQEKALIKCKDLSIKHNLNIQILDAYFTFDRNQLLFRFISDSRIDFRNLAKDLASYYKTRIELRQIGIRDKAKEVGGIGICGRELCCKKFLKDINSVSISMAKNQSISLNPNKINGCCGRLLCCLNYEDNVYKECRMQLPKVGDKVKFKNEVGTVVSVDVLNMSYDVELSKNTIVKEYVNGSTK